MATIIRNGETVVITSQELQAIKALQAADPPVTPLADQLAAFFAGLSDEARGAFLPLLGGVKVALELNDIPAIVAAVTALQVPVELDDAKAQLLLLLGVE